MAWMIDLLRMLENRTAMHTGGDDVGHLYAYLRGYRAALGIEANSDMHRDDYEYIMGFQYWLALKVHTVESLGWADLVEKYFPDRERGTAHSFYRLLKEYEVSNENGFDALKQRYEEMMDQARKGNARG
jgi:hypothetical protein